jgi:putative transposase
MGSSRSRPTEPPQASEAPYPLAADLLRRLPRVAMPRPPRLQAPGVTVHVVGRCNNREHCFNTPDDFRLVLAKLAEMLRTYEMTLHAYTLMANHVHLLLQAPTADPLARPLRWFFRETTRAWQRTHGGRGHFWERRYWSCFVEDDRYALAALRYLDRNPVRAGVVEDPAAYPWSSCAAYALGTSNPMIQFHPSYLALSPYAAVRCRHYRTLLQPSEDPSADQRDPCWTTARALGSPAFLRRYGVAPRLHPGPSVPAP